MTLTPELIADGWVEHDGSGVPNDWDGGRVLLRGYGKKCGFVEFANPVSGHWRWDSSYMKVIAYKRKPTLMPEGVTPEIAARMVAAIDAHLSGENAEPEFRAIAADMKPVDLLEEKARELVAEIYPEQSDRVLSGDYNGRRMVLARIALDAGRQLARHGLTIKQENDA